MLYNRTVRLRFCKIEQTYSYIYLIIYFQPGTSSNHRSRLPPTIRVPQSEPIGTRSRPARYQSQTLPRQLTANNSRRSQSRRRLFVDEESNNEDRNEEQPEVNRKWRNWQT